MPVEAGLIITVLPCPFDVTEKMAVLADCPEGAEEPAEGVISLKSLIPFSLSLYQLITLSVESCVV